MTTNSVGVVLCAVAVGAILFLHGCHRTETSEKVTEPVHAVPLPTPAQAAPAPVAKSLLKTARDKEYYAPGKYQRVAPNGKVVGETDCTWVPPIAKAYSPATVLSYMKSRGYTAKQINDLRLCLK